MIGLQQDQQQEEQTIANVEPTLPDTENGTVNTVAPTEQQPTLTISSTYPMDEDSDMDSSFGDAEEQQMDYWMQRCSICFDAPQDLCLDFCGDQYCHACFQRYVTEVVMSSWGLSVTTLKCPVCQEHIPQSEWSQFVPQAVVDHYDRFNQPYRSFTRCCPHCEEEAKPCDRALRKDGINYMERIRSMVESLALEAYNGPMQMYSDDDNDNEDDDSVDDGDDDDDDDDFDEDDNYYDTDDDDTMIQMYTPLHSLLLLLDDDYLLSTLLEIYKETMKTLFTFEQQYRQLTENNLNRRFLLASTILTRCRSISSTFMLLDIAPEAWKQLQFLHIAYFPTNACSNCHTDFCLQCGHETHGKLTCEENMKQMVKSTLPKDQDTVVTAQWHLNNSQRCPNCSIMINRDEGCNKVDCSMCGFCFCWACRSPWSEKCGFYHCATTEGSKDNSSTPSSTKHTEEGRAELGVPNISSIQARLLTNGAPLR